MGTDSPIKTGGEKDFFANSKRRFPSIAKLRHDHGQVAVARSVNDYFVKITSQYHRAVVM